MAAPAPIRLAWWNTGFSPGGKPQATEAMFVTAARVIGELVTNDAVGLLALGEVTTSDVEECLSRVGSAASRLQWRVPPFGRADRASSLAVLYDPTRLEFVSQALLEDTFGGLNFRTGWHLTFQPPGGGAALNVIVVHWPSHLFEDAARKRLWIAAALHKHFEQDRDVLMLGDFNDEPFSDSMRDGLVAYRDRSLVRLKRHAYYNPFWRLLGEQQHVDHEAEFRLPAGTHFHHAGSFSRWFTYDQIVVSSALLGKTAWRLVESATRVVAHEALLTRRGTMTDFDHLPVTTAVTYNPEANDG